MVGKTSLDFLKLPRPKLKQLFCQHTISLVVQLHKKHFKMAVIRISTDMSLNVGLVAPGVVWEIAIFNSHVFTIVFYTASVAR
jgi:hypothetical protein